MGRRATSMIPTRVCSFRGLPWWFCLTLILRFVSPSIVLSPAHAQDTSTSTPARDAGASDQESAKLDLQRTELAQHASALRAFASKQPVEQVRAADLLGIPLADEAAVAKAAKALETEAQALRSEIEQELTLLAASREKAKGKEAEQPPFVLATMLGESNVPEAVRLEAARLEVLDAKLSILRASPGERQAMVAADAEVVRVAEERAQQDVESKTTAEEVRRSELERQRALVRAQQAKTEAGRAIAQERAILEGVRGQLAELRQPLLEKRVHEERAVVAGSAKLEAIVAQAAAVAARSAQADRLYDDVVAELQALRKQVSAQIDDYRAPAPVPSYSGAPSLLLASEPELEQARADLTKLAAVVAKSGETLEEEYRDLAWTRLNRLVANEQKLNQLRIGLLDQVSLDKRGSVLGFGREGLAQLQREITHMSLAVRWAGLAREKMLRNWVNRFRDPFVLGDALLRAVAVLLAIYAFAYARRSRVRLRTGSKALIVRLTRSMRLARSLRRLVLVLDAVYLDLLWLGLVLVIGAWLLAPYANVIQVVYVGALAYAWYRIAFTIAHRSLALATSSGVAGVDEERGARALRSVRLVGRYCFALAVILVGSAAMLGKGYLYHLVLRFAWVGSVPIAYGLIRWWREDIIEEYLRRKPTGALADAVSATRERWYGFFVAIAALAVVLGAALWRSLQRFVLDFEQSRRALAYLFRRRLERQAVGASDVPDLTVEIHADIKRCLTQEPVEDPTLLTARFPGLDALASALEQWPHKKSVGACLVVGRSGFGKSTWLRAAQHQAKENKLVTRSVSPTVRSASVTGVVQTLSTALELGEVESSDELIAALRKGERQVVLVDDVHMWFLRNIGGLDGFRAFAEIIERTGDHVFWVVSCSHYAYEFIAWICGGKDVFRQVVRLSPWTELEIEELLQRRTEAAGLSVTYDGLVVEKLDGLAAEAQLLSTARDYNRLIWDYAEGSPRSALQAWHDSLVPESRHRARVRLFPSPNARPLDLLEEDEKFVLASVLWHGAITQQDVALALRFPPLAVAEAMQRMGELGVLERAGTLHSVATRWWPASVRFLRRNHLIES